MKLHMYSHSSDKQHLFRKNKITYEISLSLKFKLPWLYARRVVIDFSSAVSVLVKSFRQHARPTTNEGVFKGFGREKYPLFFWNWYVKLYFPSPFHWK